MAPTHVSSAHSLTRRRLLGATLSVGVLGVLGPGASHAAALAGDTPLGTWRTWLLTAGDELRPSAPPPASPDEHAEVIAM